MADKEKTVRADAAADRKGPKPSRVLPTQRIAFGKQLEMLRAYGALYVSTSMAVNPALVADLLKIHADTARLANPFFLDIGLLQKTGGGFIPAPEVIALHRAREWNEETPERKLRPLFHDTWFARALTSRLAFRGSLDETEAVALLAAEANASPDYRAQLGFLLNYLEAAGVVYRDGTNLVPLKDEAIEPSPGPSLPPQPPPQPNGFQLVAERKTTEQHLLEILDPQAMSDVEQDAVWTLLKYLKGKGRQENR